MPQAANSPGSRGKGDRMEGARRLRLLVVGSWTRVLITASILIALWAVVAWLAASGRLAELSYLNLPPLHPYPPAGFVQNPFNPGDKGDLISISEARRVKADLLQDGQVELQALEVGDPSLVIEADTGRAAAGLARLIAENNTQGVFEHQAVKLDAIVVGRLTDPSDPTLAWMVEERGMGTISRYSKASKALVTQLAVKFTARFWLVKVGQRYLVADTIIYSQSISGAGG